MMEDTVFDALDRLEGSAPSIPCRGQRSIDQDHGRFTGTTFELYHLEPQDLRQRPSKSRLPRRAVRASFDPCIVSDPFDGDALRYSDPDQRLGRARLSLEPAQSRLTRNDPTSLARPYLPYLHAYERQPYVATFPVNHQADSPSSSIAPPSSPTYEASQRHRSDEQRIWYLQNSRVPKPTAVQHSPHFRTNVFSTPGLLQSKEQTTRRPVVQGIELIPVGDLPDRFRTLFPFVCFNAIQSRCFPSIYGSKDNFVLSSPTGSGKTVIFELAICRLVLGWQSGTFKIVYMAPTKSLCAERKRDWKLRFAPLGLQCEELTGDSDIASLQNVQCADIIVTTPEKWDSMTRKWKDHEKLVRLIKLFLIDEVHILKKDRGAALEAVVSRMKSVGSDIRFVALSATVPNLHDIATWLGRDARTPGLPALREKFGEEFRPVKLQKHVCGYQSSSNPYGFDTSLNKKLPDIISKYSHGKPIMVFCFTRKSCSETAKFLANWWAATDPSKRYWKSSQQEISVENKDLRSTITAGVAVHHAGLGQDDRLVVENAYLAGQLGVICCTSTLSVGMNLPCHMVIIKNTVSYEGSQVKEYSDLEVMQMIGRAGRPQFDDNAVAVIMTRLSQVQHYEQMVNGEEQLESCLHLNLVEHLNAEIGLGTIVDLHSAKKWLHGTFLRVRLQDNPSHYQIEGDTHGSNLDERLDMICSTAISQLKTHELVDNQARLELTPYGEAMARYYVSLTTMTAIVEIPAKPKLSEILSTLAQAYEFREIRLRAGEKSIYKDLNSSPSLRFPVKVDIALPAHKVTLIIQSILGGVDTIANDLSHKVQYGIDQGLIFQHVHRLVRCIIDCQASRNDSFGIRNALFLSRSFAAKAWDDSPLTLRQIGLLGPAAVRKLSSANINSVEALANTEANFIERKLSKNPPFGHTILSQVKTFPKLHISVQARGQPIVMNGQHVNLNIAVDLGFLNDKIPTSFMRKPVYVIMLAETSDGHLLHFCRISIQKVAKAAPTLFTAQLTRVTQSINCYVMCDEIAGTLEQVSLTPDIPAATFHLIHEKPEILRKKNRVSPRIPREVPMKRGRKPRRVFENNNDEWGDGGINDNDFVDAAEGDAGFVDIDELELDMDFTGSHANSRGAHKVTTLASSTQQDPKEPTLLENGKWECNHACKDKTKCKHLCCREGVDKRSKPKKVTQMQKSKTQSKIDLALAPKRKQCTPMVERNNLEHIDLSEERRSKKARCDQKLISAEPTSRHMLSESPRGTLYSRGSMYSSPSGDESHLIYPRAHDHKGSQSCTDDNFDDSLIDDLDECAIQGLIAGASEIAETNQLEPNVSQGSAMQRQGVLDETTMVNQEEDEVEDQDMLDAVLTGAEDSHILSSQSGLFLSEDSAEGYPALAPNNVDGKGASSPRSQEYMTLVTTQEATDGTSHAPGTPELRAWLAAEIGDCVELVDFVE